MQKIVSQTIYYFKSAELDFHMQKQGESLRIEISERGDITGVALVMSPTRVKQMIETLDKRYNDIVGGAK